jgi:predicted PurR-regulated permease PerM
MIVIVLLVVALAVVVTRGLIDQGQEIAAAVESGMRTLEAWLAEWDLDPAVADAVGSAASSLLPSLGQGVVSALGGFFSSVAAFFVGIFFGVFTLFFALRDGRQFNAWLGRHLGVEPELGTAIVDDAERAIRGYFAGTAITAAATAPIVGVPMILLGLPLVVPVLIVYFVTSFVPYLGAWVGGAFAVIIALGAGGIEAAAVITVVVVISNGSIQSAINARVIGGRLKLHAVVVLTTTAAAGMVGGITLMILATPLVATVTMTLKRLQEAKVFDKESGAGAGE